MKPYCFENAILLIEISKGHGFKISLDRRRVNESLRSNRIENDVVKGDILLTSSDTAERWLDSKAGRARRIRQATTSSGSFKMKPSIPI